MGDAKALQSMGLDPKALASMGVDPKALASMGVDPKALASLGMDPKALASMGMDPKMLASMGMDPKMLASMGIDPSAMMMMAGYGGLPGMSGLSAMSNPLLAGLPGYGLPGMPNLEISASTSKEKPATTTAAAAAAAAAQAAAAAVVSSAASLSLPGMFSGSAAAGLMYPPMGLGGLGAMGMDPKTLASMGLTSLASSALSSSALLNGIPASITTIAGSSKRPITSTSSSKQSQERLPREDRQDRLSEGNDDLEASPNSRKVRFKEQGGLSKEERFMLKQMKADRAKREGHVISSPLLEAQLDLSIHRSGSRESEKVVESAKKLSMDSETEKMSRNISITEVENGEKSEGGEGEEESEEKS